MWMQFHENDHESETVHLSHYEGRSQLTGAIAMVVAIFGVLILIKAFNI